MKKISTWIKNKDKKVVWVYFVLRFLVMISMITQFVYGNYTNTFLCVLTLFLFMIPSIIEKNFKIDLPNTLEIVVLLFIFCAQILGEIRNFYGLIPIWDTMLHTTNGFLMAAIGFSLVDILNNYEKIHFKLSPVFVAIVAFCFSMTTGIIWEFFEFGMDRLFNYDMQKDRYVTEISTVKLHDINDPIIIENVKTTLKGNINGNEEIIELNGYLDIGLIDTMKDLIVNCIGAIVFSIIGIFYLKGRGKLAHKFIPVKKNK